jgi:hypothetical protein
MKPFFIPMLFGVREPLKNCRFAQQSFKKSGRKFQYLAIFSSKQPVFLEN